MFRHLTRAAVLLVLVATTASSLAAQNPPPLPQRPPVFRGGANFVLVDVYPVANGRIVEGLTAADFQVFESGKPQKVEQFEFIRVEPTIESERRDPRTQAEAIGQAADPHNRVFVVYLDTYHVTVTGSHSARRPLVDMLDRMLAPNDLFGVTTPTQRARDLVFGRRTTTIDAQLSQNWIWGLRESFEKSPEEQRLEGCFQYYDHKPLSGEPRYVNDGAVKRKIGDVFLARWREDKVLTHLEDVISHVGAIREARTALVLFTNGWVLRPPDPTTAELVLKTQLDEIRTPMRPGVYVGPGGLGVGDRSSNTESTLCNLELQRLFAQDFQQRFRDVVALANRHNVTFYPVNPNGIDVFESSLSDRPPVIPDAAAAAEQDRMRLTFRTETMRSLASGTDGLAVITNDLAGGLKQIANDVSAYYVLGYYSTNPRFDGGYRPIEVKLNRTGVRLHGRRGYFAPKMTSPAAATPASATTVPVGVTDALAALARLSPTTELFAHGAIEGSDAIVVAELPTVALTSTTAGAGLEIQIAAGGAVVATATARVDSGTRGVLVRVPLQGARADTLQVTLKRTSGVPGEARLDLRPNASPWLGDPIVFRAPPALRGAARPAADYRFRRTERVHIEWPLRDDLATKEARLLSRTGQPLAVPVALAEQHVDGRRLLVADLIAAPLAEGDYVIELAAGPAGDPERRYLAIRIVR
jgi:VWFA-related protein